MSTIIESLEKQSKSNPHNYFLCDVGSNPLDYNTFYKKVWRIAGWLSNNSIKPGHRIIIAMPNKLEFYLLFFAILLNGGIAIPISSRIRRPRFEYIIRDSGAAACYLSSQTKINLQLDNDGSASFFSINREGDNYQLDHYTSSIHTILDDIDVPPLLPSPQDLAMIIYTSGSTGNPKGVMISHQNIEASVSSISAYLELSNEDTILNFLSPSFDYGLYQSFLAVNSGCNVVLLPQFTFIDDYFSALNRYRPTILPLMPTVIAKLMNTIHNSKSIPLDTIVRHSVRIITSTGDILHPSQINFMETLFPNAKIFSMYGLTECKRVSFLPPKLVKTKPYCVGGPMPGVRVLIVDSDGNTVSTGDKGELCVIGSNVAIGYWNDPQLTKKHFKELPSGERALLTNDIFSMDNDGHLYFHGRIDDIIKSGGHRISLKEVAVLIQEIEEVNQVHVESFSDKTHGALIKAYVVLYDSSIKNPETMIRRKLRSMVDTEYMIPYCFEFVPEIPVNQNLKPNSSMRKNE